MHVLYIHVHSLIIITFILNVAIIRIHVYYELKCLCVNYVCKLYSLHSSSLSTRLRSSSSSSIDDVSLRQNGGRQSVPATKWLATKCPCNEMAGDKLYLRRNSWRRLVPTTKWQATKRRRRNGGDKMEATKQW